VRIFEATFSKQLNKNIFKTFISNGSVGGGGENSEKKCGVSLPDGDLSRTHVTRLRAKIPKK
jgi:hypothetical protein